MIFDKILFGGSFNPIHLGHLKIIEYLLNHSICENLIVMPAYQSPFKKNQSYAPAEIRLLMVDKAVNSYFSESFKKKILISDFEIKKKEISYTIDTVRKFLSDKSAILVGSDHIDSLHLWKDIEILLKNYNFVVFPRNHFPLTEIRKKIKKINNYYSAGNFFIVEYEVPTCSSSEIRKKISLKSSYQEVQECLLYDVYLIIQQYHLYEK